MRIAHFSDLHLEGTARVPAWRYLNKRLAGWANLRFRRRRVHHADYVRAIAREIARGGFDHVVVTGDLTNLALESEYAVARDLLERDLGLTPEQVTVIPGNHDVYTRGALAGRRFERYFGPWLQSDLPDFSADVGGARFPVVKLRGTAAVIGLSSAAPMPPFVAAGQLGRAQIAALARLLEHPEVRGRSIVLAVHHPVVHPWPPFGRYREGLRDAAALVDTLRWTTSGVLLHGHLHRRIQRDLSTDCGRLRQVGATSASLQHRAVDRMAGFNVVSLGDGGSPASTATALRVEAFVYSPRTGTFRPESVPRHV